MSIHCDVLSILGEVIFEDSGKIRVAMVAGVSIFEDLEAACRDVDVAVLLSGVRPGGSREEVMARTVELYCSIGSALEQHASRDVKVGAHAASL